MTYCPRGKQILIEELKRKHGRNSVFACAPTGVAALLINGQTLHSLAGCGVPTKKEDMKKMWNDATKKKWRKMKVLVRRINLYRRRLFWFTIEMAQKSLFSLCFSDAEGQADA
jgi:hypothetical protein